MWKTRTSTQKGTGIDVRTINQSFSLVGLHLRPAALKKVQEKCNSEKVENLNINPNNDDENQSNVLPARQCLESLVTSVKLYHARLEGKDIPKFLDEKFIDDVFSWAQETNVTYNKKAHLGDGVFVYDAFKDIPKFQMVDEQMIKVLGMPSIFPEVNCKMQMMRNRLIRLQEIMFAPGSGYLKSAHSSEVQRYEFLRGYSNKYVANFQGIGIRPSPTEEFSAGGDLQDGDMRERGLGCLVKGQVFEVLEWLVKVDGGWFLKVKVHKESNKYIIGWVPYRYPKKEGILAEPLVGPYLGTPGSRTASLVTSVESLRGNPGPKVALGYLTRIGEQWVLEDQQEAVNVDMRYIASTADYITRGCFIVAEGFVDNRDSIFRIERIWHPPYASESLRSLNDRNYFGGAHSREDLVTLGGMKIDDFYVILNDVHLDNDEVLEKLELIIQKFEGNDEAPSYVLMGNFCSRPFDPYEHDVMDRWKAMFKRFFELLQKYQHTREKRIILIPGPKDPFCHGILPCKPLPKFIDSPENVIYATNPCRIRHTYNKIIFCRHELTRELNRQQVVPLQVTGQQADLSYVKYLAHQAHLSPLPLTENPVMWAFDHALNLEPWPDVCIIGDSRKPFDLVYENCAFGCVYPFKQGPTANWSFYIYRPNDKMEESLQAEYAVQLFEDEAEDIDPNVDGDGDVRMY